jgi:Domain of unknown function (DUF5655)
MDNVSAEHTVDDHFSGKPPAVREVYDRLLAAVRTVGPVVEEPKKTSIHLVRSSALAGVEVRKEYREPARHQGGAAVGAAVSSESEAVVAGGGRCGAPRLAHERVRVERLRAAR